MQYDYLMDEELIKQIIGEIKDLQERLYAIEKEQRKIREDILSGAPKERMQKRILEQPKTSREEKREKIANQIKIEI